MTEINMNYYKIVKNKVYNNHNFLYPLTVNLIMACCNTGGNAGYHVFITTNSFITFTMGDLVNQKLHKFLQIY